MGISFPGESAESRVARDRLLLLELEQRRAMEAVAAARRALPPGGPVPEDYVFQRAGAGGTAVDLRMSEMFAPGLESLAIYSFMYGPDRETPCRGCVAQLDALNGVAAHIRDRVNFVVAATSPLPRILAYAEVRGWHGMSFLSAADNTYTRDYFGVDPTGGWEVPMLNVFTREGGVIRHFWGSELLFEPTEPDQGYRHNDTIHPLWGMLDLTPEGRGAGQWEPKLSYA